MDHVIWHVVMWPGDADFFSGLENWKNDSIFVIVLVNEKSEKCNSTFVSSIWKKCQDKNDTIEKMEPYLSHIVIFGGGLED